MRPHRFPAPVSLSNSAHLAFYSTRLESTEYLKIKVMTRQISDIQSLQAKGIPKFHGQNDWIFH